MNMNLTIQKIKGARMARKFLVSILLIALSVSASTSLLEQKVDSIEAKRGLQVGGDIRAVLLNSTFSSKQDLDGINRMPDTERMQFVNADLAFTFRPWEPVRVNAILRMQAGMQNYFASPSKSISTPWLNIEGNIASSFYWVVGNFRQQYSPLTLYTPGIDVMYEPLVFAQKRQMAQEQSMLDGNQRLLQGANLQFRHYFNKSVGELRAEALAARLRRVQVLDFTGAVGNILPNPDQNLIPTEKDIPGASQASNMDKFLLSSNIELLPLDKNLLIGFTWMYIFDDKKSFTYTYHKDDNDDFQFTPVNPFDLSEQKTSVMSARAGVDVAKILNNDKLTLNTVVEFATDNDQVEKLNLKAFENGVIELKKEDERGTALLVSLDAGYKINSSWSLALQSNVIRNDSLWFNNLAQSPQFFARRILNTDKDGHNIKYGVNAPLYSSFGALYYFSPKFTPVATTLGTDDNAIGSGQTKSYNIAPFNKNSWTSTVYTKSELALLESLSDPALQLALPNGFATANRQGGTATLKVNWSDFAEAQGLYSIYRQVKPMASFDKASYVEYGGGAKVLPLKGVNALSKTPFSELAISGSYKHAQRKVEFISVGNSNLNTDFINAGLYIPFLPRLALSGGFQLINTEMNDIAASFRAVTSPGHDVPLLKGTQTQWMAGLDYGFSENAWLNMSVGQIGVKNTYNTSSSTEYKNLPSYYVADSDETGSYKHSYTQYLIEASINVGF